MNAALVAARAELRRRPAATVALALLVALVTAVVLATGSGARRTSTVVDRFFDVTNTRDIGFFAITLGSETSADGRELAERIGARMDEVDGIIDRGVAVGYPTAASDEFDVTVIASPDRSQYVDIDRPIVREGRLPADDAPEEVAINDVAAQLLGVRVGDTFPAPTFSPEDCRVLKEQDRFPGFNGPLIELEVVGRVVLGDDLRGSGATAGPAALGSHAFLARYGDDTCATVVFGSARVGPGGPSTAQIQTLVDAETRGLEKALVSTAEEDFGRTVRAGAGVVTTVLLLVTAGAAVAGLLAIAQAIRRQAVAGAEVSRTLAAFGSTRWERAVGLAVPGVVALVAGVGLGVPFAWLMSDRFPVSLARVVETVPGRSFDALVLVGGGVALVLLGTAWALIAARQADLATLNAAPTRPSRAAELAARSGLRPPAVIGLRLAFDTGPPRARVPSRSALAGVAAGVLGVVAVLVLIASVDDTLDEPARYGWAWSSMPDIEGEDPLAVVEGLKGGEEVRAAARLLGGAVEVDGRRLQAHAIEDIFGNTELVIAEGRAPASDDEVALGGGTLADLSTSIGGVVVAQPAGADPVELKVVGRAVLPLVNDSPDPGNGIMLTRTALEAFTRGEVESNAVLTYPPAADTATTEAALIEQGFAFPGYADPQAPGRLLNLRDVRGVFVALVAFLALLAVAGVAHALAVSGRLRRADFAILRSLGFTRGQVRRTIWSQSAAIAVTGLVIGLPLGVIAGRVAWQATVSDLHMLDPVSVPLGALALVTVVAIGIIAAVAIVPGILAARRRPAELLRAE